VSYRKKLIEVALPLEAINRESAREKSIRHGHPSTLHLWWARRPLAACRAVLFASIVDDPSSRPEEFPTEEEQERERQRLFGIIEELVKWENSNNERVLEAAREEIRKATNGNPPPVLDPFCGGGSIPLEAQRLGLEAHASDLNPVAVLITKALIEIAPKFAGKPPVNPESRAKLAHTATWNGAQGLAEDVRYYGRWMRDEAFKRVGHLYPKAKLPDGDEATVIAWLWARTVPCSNPACGAEMPLVRSFALSTKNGNERHVQPLVDGDAKTVRFEVRKGSCSLLGTVGRRGAICVVCGASVPLEHVRVEAKAGRMGVQMIAMACEGERGRIYLGADPEHQRVAAGVRPPDDAPDSNLPERALGFRVQGYGMTKHRDLFTPRQLVVLMTFSELVGEVREHVFNDGKDEEYADAVATYLAFAVDRSVDRGSTICTWDSSPKMEALRNTFARQAIPMTWDFAEGNPFSASSGSWLNNVEWSASVAERIQNQVPAYARQLDATAAINGVAKPLVATDPPYYDNVPYADLSDFFYVWLRRSLGSIHRDLFSTLLTPKAQELVADVYRFGGSRRAAHEFFEHGMATVFSHAHKAADSRYPTTLFYAFKQAEAEDGAAASTGWDTMLSGLVGSGFAVTGTWPMRSELGNRMRNIASNALASSIVLVCRPRPVDASLATRREFSAALKAELPAALKQLQHGNIAPVDLAQAAIGPGMAVFSRYAKIVEASGEAMTVRTALGLINHALDEILAEQEADLDPYSRFAVAWFEQYAFEEGPYGAAETFVTAKATAVKAVEEAGILVARAGKVRLLRRDELDPGWDPATDRRLTVWEVVQHLIRRLEEGGETAAAELLNRVGGLGQTARELAYRLYGICERKGWAQEALGYNALAVAWPEIARRVAGTPEAEAQQRLEI
jgi:putative DNA methylase